MRAESQIMYHNDVIRFLKGMDSLSQRWERVSIWCGWSITDVQEAICMGCMDCYWRERGHLQDVDGLSQMREKAFAEYGCSVADVWAGICMETWAGMREFLNLVLCHMTAVIHHRRQNSIHRKPLLFVPLCILQLPSNRTQDAFWCHFPKTE